MYRLLPVLILTGCSASPVIQRAADANDRAVSAAEFTICYGASVGSIRRAFAHRQDVWELLCSADNDFTPIGETDVL